MAKGRPGRSYPSNFVKTRSQAIGCSLRELVEVIEWKNRNCSLQSQQMSFFEAMCAGCLSCVRHETENSQKGREIHVSDCVPTSSKGCVKVGLDVVEEVDATRRRHTTQRGCSIWLWLVTSQLSHVAR